MMARASSSLPAWAWAAAIKTTWEAAAGAGLMVNYLYELKSVEKNHEAFANHGKVVASARVGKLLKAISHPNVVRPA